MPAYVGDICTVYYIICTVFMICMIFNSISRIKHDGVDGQCGLVILNMPANVGW